MPTSKKAPAPATGTKTGVVETSGRKAKVTKQPQSKQQAAKSGGIFLHTDDQWAQAYFNTNDLHCEERQLFG
ncbi:MAG TPA: hypothetical protein VHY84_20500 [Bryobacteraceae bacterium]|jgi:hypothetical protein|nr:hypothetical protein [Bryobacteraceae bacterium]